MYDVASLRHVLPSCVSFKPLLCDPQASFPTAQVLGNTGLQVSVLSYGFWATFGAKSDLKEQAGIEKAKECLRVVRDAGVNLIDNAEVYGKPYGSAEVIMGEALRQLALEDPHKWRRSDLVITTKIFWGGEGSNEKGLSVKHLREGLDASLNRLQVVRAFLRGVWKVLTLFDPSMAATA